jgi:hypothetical protein
MQKLLSLCIVAVFMAACSSPKTTAAKTSESEALNKLLEDRSFIFVVERVNVPGGRPRFFPETYYNLTVNSHKVSADLPYFGQSAKATMSGGESIVFSSEQYTYGKGRGKRGWNIEIKPEGNVDIKVCNLYVMDDGTASLIVGSIRRQTISYDGSVYAISPAK